MDEKEKAAIGRLYEKREWKWFAGANMRFLLF